MHYENNTVPDLKIAYIGGGSRGWAWTLMNDLAKAKDLSGDVFLYDIDFPAADKNEIIGNSIENSNWRYHVAHHIGEALIAAQIVIVSILPATFDEMQVDVHSCEKYGIYQSVGDTTGPGGFFRTLRTVPMMQDIARNVRTYCHTAWVINYTNPMANCLKALYKEFPAIKAIGCCHEVFGTQKLLSHALAEIEGIENVHHKDIAVNVVGVNHFTWFTKAQYRNLDLFKTYEAFVDRYYESGYEKGKGEGWETDPFRGAFRVRFDLFRRFGYIAAAGDRHLAEFMDAGDYLADPETVKSWKFGLTTVDYRREKQAKREEESRQLVSGEKKFTLKETGEEGVDLIRALLGLEDKITNVNFPNMGQIPNLPLGTIVETNAIVRANTVIPVYAGEIPEAIYPYVSRIAAENDRAVDASFSGDLKTALAAFKQDHLVQSLKESDQEELFNTMYEGTKAYLKHLH